MRFFVYKITTWFLSKAVKYDCFPKIKNSTKTWCSDFISGCILKIIQSKIFQIHLCTPAHSNITPYSEEVEAIQIASDSWMIKQNAITYTNKEEKEYYSALGRENILTQAIQ